MSEVSRMHELGFLLLPVEPQSKEEAWAELPEAETQEAQLERWLREYDRERIERWAEQGGNLAVQLGQASGGLWVIDLDHPDRLRGLRVQPTLTAVTGRSIHLFYRSRCEVPTRQYDWGDVRGEGHRVLVPPSRHPSGVRYQFLEGELGRPEPELVEPGVLDQLLQCGLGEQLLEPLLKAAARQRWSNLELA